MADSIGTVNNQSSIQPNGHSSHSNTTESLWRGTDYGKWFVADSCTSLSSSIQGFAMPLIAQTVTGSPAQATLLDSIMTMISSVLRLPGGVVQDKYDRKKLMIAFGLIGFALFGICAALGWAGLLIYPVLMVLAICLGIRSGLLGTTSNTMLRGIVPDQLLPKASSLNDGRDAALELAGAPVGGVLIGGGLWLPFAVSALLNLLETAAAMRITKYWHRGGRTNAEGRALADDEADENGDAANITQAADEQATTTTSSASQYWREMFSGFRWLLSERFERRLILSSALAFACFNSFLLITVLSIGSDPSHVVSASFMNVSVSVGVIVGSLISSVLVQHVRGGIVAVSFYVLMSIGALGAALAPWILARMAFLAISLLALPAGNAVINGFQSLLINKEHMGRVFAGMGMIETIAAPVITFLSGIAMQHWGYSVTSVALGLCIVAAAIPAVTMRELVTLPKPDGWEDHIRKSGLTKF